MWRKLRKADPAVQLLAAILALPLALAVLALVGFAIWAGLRTLP